MHFVVSSPCNWYLLGESRDTCTVDIKWREERRGDADFDYAAENGNELTPACFLQKFENSVSKAQIKPI